VAESAIGRLQSLEFFLSGLPYSCGGFRWIRARRRIRCTGGQGVLLRPGPREGRRTWRGGVLTRWT